jgi:hypothetical protein
LIADAIQLLRRVPVPQDASSGRYVEDMEGRIIVHQLFNNHESRVPTAVSRCWRVISIW